MMKNENFAVFILTFGRPNKVLTYNTLQRAGYTGKVYLICSTDDKTLNQYKEKFGDKVIVFNKEDYKGTFDIGDNFNEDNVVVYARNASFDIARDLGLEYFLQLDDDYLNFHFRVVKGDILDSKNPKDVDKIMDYYVDFLKSTPVSSIAWAQGGDFIGGKNNPFFTNRESDGRKRKVMNSFFLSPNRPFKFLGRINEDTTAYTQNGKLGHIFITHPYFSIAQPQTQTNSGGLTEFYLSTGTFVKSFYTILFNPSSVKIGAMGDNHLRLHHRISWNNTIPCIISQEYKKY